MFESIIEMRAADFRAINAEFWSKGLPALATPIRPRVERVLDHNGRVVDVDRVKMAPRPVGAKNLTSDEWRELRTLIATQRVEPSISREVHDDLRGSFKKAQALSLDLALDGDGDLHDVVADEVEFEVEVESYADDLDNDLMDLRYGVAYEALDPTIRDRIEWEQQVQQDGTVSKARFVRTARGVEVFLYPRPKSNNPDPKQRAAEIAAETKERTARAVKAFMAAHHLTEFPSPDEFSKISTAAKAWKKTPAAARIAAMAREIRDAIDDLDATRDLDDEIADTSVVVSVDDDWDTDNLPAGEYIVHHRSPRTGQADELWHQVPQDEDEALSTLGIGNAESDLEIERLLGLTFDDEDEAIEGLSDRYVIQITGDRNWPDDPKYMAAVLGQNAQFDPKRDILITGCARGADSAAGKAAEAMGFAVKHMPADWDRHGKGAGPIRNQQMVDVCKSARALGMQVIVLAFHTNLATSRGTKDMVDRCLKAGFGINLFTNPDVPQSQTYLAPGK